MELGDFTDSKEGNAALQNVTERFKTLQKLKIQLVWPLLEQSREIVYKYVAEYNTYRAALTHKLDIR